MPEHETPAAGAAGDAGAGGAGMTGLQAGLATAENYRRFARLEAAGRSPAYESLASAVAGDEAVLHFLESLPPAKRQPNLLFAAARYLLDAVPGPADLRHLVVADRDRLARVMLGRRTQTNEPARCATLLPALCRLPQPLALIEVGASAGLTLLADRYSYDYHGTILTGADPDAPTLRCRADQPTPVPAAVPGVVWRQGIDLNPLDPADPDDVHWLECLIWPGEDGRLDRLHGAVAAARRHPVRVRPGDLLDDLAEVVAAAPASATVVVFHSAVLAYVDGGKRASFARAVADLGVTWLSNEAPGVLDGVSAHTERNGFLLVQDGRTVLAETDPHGTWMRWMAPAGLRL